MLCRRGALSPLDDDAGLPAVARVDDIDLAAEGLDLETLREQLAGRAAPEQPGGSPTAVHEEPSAAATAGDGSGIAADRTDASSADADLEPTFSAIEARLDQLESAVMGREYSARVVDVGDGTILLRLEEPPAQITHGQEVNIRLSDDATLLERER